MKTKRYFVQVFFLVMWSFTSYAQDTAIKWLEFEKIPDLFAVQAKPVFIYVYSPGCDSCAIMDTTTLQDQGIIDYFNQATYAIRMDMYSQDTLTFFDGTVFYPEKGQIHPIVRFMMGDTIPQHAFICFSKKASGTVYPGFRSVNKMYSLLIYYWEDIVEDVTYDEYYVYYNKTYPEDNTSGYSMVRSVVKWMTLEEALKQNEQAPKKIFLDLNVNWRNGCTIMLMHTYNDPTIGNILNTEFYPVKLDAQTKDTLNVFNYSYINEGADHGYHQLPIALLGGVMKFPMILVFDENNKLVATEQSFFTPKTLEPFLKYYSQSKYTQTQYTDFLKTFEGSLYKASEQQ